ncbi:hypothetical protein CCP3SC15_1170006 [Gammaproteobacteria bacterium]
MVFLIHRSFVSINPSSPHYSNKLPSLRDTLNMLQETGFWLDNRLYKKLLKEVGEQSNRSH